MALIELTVQHHRTQEEARAQLEKTVQEVCSRFGGMVQKVNWSEDRNQVSLSGSGCEVDLRVDPVAVHFRGDMPFLAGLLGGVLSSGVKQLLQKNFDKQLPLSKG
jgi:hypothetical protein